MLKRTKIQTEVKRTKPDYVVYIPKSLDGSTKDTGNEHFLVFDGHEGSLLAVWTQSTFEGLENQRIVFVRSDDHGSSWTDPKIIAGSLPTETGGMASWGFPMISKSGRIYVLYNKHIGINDIFTHTTGLMAGIYSDDVGKTWSKPEIINMPRSIYDNPDPSIPANWIVWQKPTRLSGDKYFVGFTRWVSPSVRREAPILSWATAESVVEFMRFENIDNDPLVKDIRISYFANDEHAIRVSWHHEAPEHSVAQEPSIVQLPDNRLFCVLRTTTGSPYYTISNDSGMTWTKTEILKYADTGKPVLHPLSPCPIYRISEDKYVIFYHNNDGHFEQWGPFDTDWNRRPVYISAGTYKANAKQPVWFSEPKFFMDNEGVVIGHKNGRCDLALYSSFTNSYGKNILWYPDRKFFLLGREIKKNLLSLEEL
ncbi:MAG: sialidase family protein [Sedimentisphaerales bacterium]